MPKYDAFGRRIGEDTLAGLGGSPSKPTEPSWQERNERDAATWQAAENVEVARLQTAADAADAKADRAEDERQDAAGASRWTAAAPRTITVKRRGAGRGCLVAMIVLLSVAGLLVAGVIGLVSSVDINSGGTISGRPQQAAAPKGLSAGSLVRRGNLAAALTELRSSGAGRLTSLRVAPDRIDATLLTPAGRLRNLQVKPGGRVERLGPDSGPGFDQTRTIPFSRLDPAAPQRLARAGAARLHVAVSTLQYAVPTLFLGTLSWGAYFEHGRHVLGDASGRFQRAF